MKTRLIKIDPNNIDARKIEQAVRVIEKGGVVAFPTDTVYGLGAGLFNKKAVERIYKVKKRPKNKPLTVQIPDITYLDQLADQIPAFAYQLMSKFWPGPLTLVLRAKNSGTIGLRIPDNKIARALLEKSRRPLVVPSANLSGQPAAQTAQQALNSFAGLIEMVIDGGSSKLGVSSTVVDLTVSPFKILRKGAISRKEIGLARG